MKNLAVRRILDAGGDANVIRARIEQALRCSGGPLVQPDEDGSVSVTFVCSGTTNRPVLSCPLIPNRALRCAMDPVPGTADVWWAEATAQADACVSYHFETGARTSPPLSGDPLADPTQFAALSRDRYEASLADRFNPYRCFPMTFLAAHAGQLEPTPPLEKWDSILELPAAEPYRWHREPLRRGQSDQHVVSSEALGNRRRVTVWTPPGGVVGDDYPVVVLLDGEAFRLGMRAQRIFDNLVGGGHVRPFVAVLVDNASPTSRMSEYACDPALGIFLAEELLPALRRPYRLTDKPTETAIGGFSLGGLAASWLGLARGGTFGNVLSMSSALWWSNNRGSDHGPEWVTRQYVARTGQPPKLWIDVGSLETAPLPFADGLSMLALSRRFRAAVQSTGYDLIGYHEQSGGHDYANWRRTLPLALSALWGTGPGGPTRPAR